MAKPLCHLLMKVNHAIVAIFKVEICLLTVFAKIQFSRKFLNLQYLSQVDKSTIIVIYSEARQLIFGLALPLPHSLFMREVKSSCETWSPTLLLVYEI